MRSLGATTTDPTAMIWWCLGPAWLLTPTLLPHCEGIPLGLAGDGHATLLCRLLEPHSVHLGGHGPNQPRSYQSEEFGAFTGTHALYVGRQEPRLKMSRFRGVLVLGLSLPGCASSCAWIHKAHMCESFLFPVSGRWTSSSVGLSLDCAWQRSGILGHGTKERGTQFR